jgi:carbon-monoxide dehydrogenase small subunit
MSKREVTVTVNGQQYRREVEPRMLLVDFLREAVGLTGTHVGCDTSNCGACTIIMEGRTIKSCTYLAVAADGREIVTIEGVAQNGDLHPIQKAFWENHGLQCGYCTPGMVLSAVYLLSKNPNPTELEIRRGIAGNVCRCTGYQGIVDSIQAAAEKK